jgi:hypothetical protein
VHYSPTIDDAQTKSGGAYISPKWLEVPAKVGSGQADCLIKRSDKSLLTGKIISNRQITRWPDTEPETAESIDRSSEERQFFV